MSIIFTIISFVIDTLDGSVARFEEPTIFGGILDIFCDRLVEVFIIIAIVATNPSNLIWPGMFTLAAIVMCISMFLIVGGIIKRDELDKWESRYLPARDFGLLILTTTEGIISNAEARKKGIGGKLLAYIY